MAPCSLNSRTGKDKVIDMKKIGIVIMLLMASWCANAQDCSVLVLPYFGNSTDAMSRCPADKLQYFCLMAQTAFYESDTVPSGSEVVNIIEVRESNGTNYLPQDYVVNLNSLSYFAYNFHQFQLQDFDKPICFSTPSSTHAYLILRSYSEMMEIVEREFRELQTR